jgi:hypothetical protein
MNVPAPALYQCDFEWVFKKLCAVVFAAGTHIGKEFMRTYKSVESLTYARVLYVSALGLLALVSANMFLQKSSACN